MIKQSQPLDLVLEDISQVDLSHIKYSGKHHKAKKLIAVLPNNIKLQLNINEFKYVSLTSIECTLIIKGILKPNVVLPCTKLITIYIARIPNNIVATNAPPPSSKLLNQPSMNEYKGWPSGLMIWPKIWNIQNIDTTTPKMPNIKAAMYTAGFFYSNFKFLSKN